MTIPDCAAEIEPMRDKGSSAVRAWKFTLFIGEHAVAEAIGDTVPLAAQWCARRLRENATRGLQVLEAMGFDTTEPPARNSEDKP